MRILCEVVGVIPIHEVVAEDGEEAKEYQSDDQPR